MAAKAESASTKTSPSQQDLERALMWMVLGIAFCAAWGSFVSTVALRAGRGEDWMEGRSRCDHCGRQLAAFELVPVLSYVALSGRCRSCEHRVDATHPIGEAAAVLFGGAGFLIGGLEGALLTMTALIWLAIALYDFATLRIPDIFTISIAALGIFSSIGAPVELGLKFVVAAFVLALLSFLARHFHKKLGRPALGGGDVKLAAAGALTIDPLLVPWAFVAAGVAGLIFALLRDRSQRDAKMAFAPFLALGFWSMQAFGLWFSNQQIV